jgi:methanogenic corrinoid protein MtbC1
VAVSESSIKRWADEGHIHVSRTQGGHRRITTAEAIRFIRTSGMVLQEPELLGLGDLAAVEFATPSPPEAGSVFLEFLLADRAREARGLLIALYIAGADVHEIIDGPVQEAIDRLGEHWRDDDTRLDEEHRATEICAQALTQLRFLLPEDAGAPYALGGAVPGDRSALGSLAAAVALRAAGFRVVNLGPDASLPAFAQAGKALDASVAWLSANRVIDEESLRAGIGGLHESLTARGTRLLLIGPEAKRVPLPPQASVEICSSVGDLVGHARIALGPAYRDTPTGGTRLPS